MPQGVGYAPGSRTADRLQNRPGLPDYSKNSLAVPPIPAAPGVSPPAPSAPRAPAPVQPAPAPAPRMAAPLTPSAAPRPGAATADTLMGRTGGFGKPGPGLEGGGVDQIVAGLPPELQAKWNDLNMALWSRPDYKGRAEANRALLARYAQFLASQARESQIDLTNLAPYGDLYRKKAEQLNNELAAQGVYGSGASLGAQALLGAEQSAQQGQVIRDMQEQRRREQFLKEQEFEKLINSILMGGIDANLQEQNDSGFLGDVLGGLGGIVGSIIPGVGSAIGGKIADVIGGGRREDEGGY